MSDIKVMLKPIDITYDALKTLKDSDALTKGNQYRITDFRTIYKRKNGFYINPDNGIDEPVWITDGRAEDENPSTVEPLIVTAITSNSFAAKAISELYPEDIIYFSFDENMRNKGYVIYDSENTKGFIYRRINKNKVDMPYDFRNCRWRRWEVDYESIPVWNPSHTYSSGSVVRNSGAVNNIVYVAIKSVPANTNPTAYNSSCWIGIFDLKDTKYIATSPNYFNSYDSEIVQNTWNILYDTYFGAEYGFVNIPVTSNYRDLLTFSMNSGEEDVNIDGSNCRNNYVRSGYDNVFYSNGSACNSNTIGNNCESNTIGNNFNNNIIGNDFKFNTINTLFLKNTIGNGFNSNTIGNSFSANVIGNNFSSNIIGRSFYSNAISNYFESNTIGNEFHYNTIGDHLYANTIGYTFESNIIGNEFNSNTISIEFCYNTIGNHFETNEIGVNFNANTIGNYFYGNTIRNHFYSNSIGNYFYYNTVGNEFRYNSVLNWTDDSTSYDFSSETELHNSMYTHVIQLDDNGDIIISWYSGETSNQIVLVI